MKTKLSHDARHLLEALEAEPDAPAEPVGPDGVDHEGIEKNAAMLDELISAIDPAAEYVFSGPSQEKTAELDPMKSMDAAASTALSRALTENVAAIESVAAAEITKIALSTDLGGALDGDDEHVYPGEQEDQAHSGVEDSMALAAKKALLGNSQAESVDGGDNRSLKTENTGERGNNEAGSMEDAAMAALSSLGLQEEHTDARG